MAPQSGKAEIAKETNRRSTRPISCVHQGRERAKQRLAEADERDKKDLIRHLCSTIIMSWRCECMYPSYKDKKKPVACVDSWQCMVLKCMEGVQLAELKPSEVMSQQYGVLFAYGGAYSPKRSVHQCFFYFGRT